MSDIPAIALSIMQPWAWLITSGVKQIENRDWRTSYRGAVAIHAGKTMDRSCLRSMLQGFHPANGNAGYSFFLPDTWQTGGIVGVAEIVDCVDQSDDPWFVGEFGFVLRNARPVNFIPVRGALGFFNWKKMLEKSA